MSSSTNPQGTNPPPASQSQDQGVRISDTTPRFPTGTDTQHQQQFMTVHGMNVPVLPSSTNEAQDNQIRTIPIDPEDLRLPLNNILRMMRSALPENAVVGKDAKEAMEKCVVEFIQFLTSEGSSNSRIRATFMRPVELTHFSRSAAENASGAHRKVLHGDDVLRALKNTGFEHYAEALKPYLEGYRARERRNTDFDLGLEEEDEETVAAGKRRRAPTPESPPSSS